MNDYNKWTEAADKLKQICIDNRITIIIHQHPYKHRYYPTNHLIIDSIPPFKP